MKMTNGGGLVTIAIAEQTTQHPNQWPLENAAISKLWYISLYFASNINTNILNFYFTFSCIIHHHNVCFYMITIYNK